MELPDNMLIPCPDVGFQFRIVGACFVCEHYKGLSKPIVGGVEVEDCQPEEIHIICGRPTTRKLTSWINK